MWAKIDDGFFDNPKARAAGKDGRALFLAGLCWAAGQLTGGRIASTDLALVAAKAEVRPSATVRRLVDVGLWEPVAGGWLIHDFGDWNPDADKVAKIRHARSEAGRRGGQRSRPPGSKSEAIASDFAQANGEANSEATAEAKGEANGEAKRKQKRTPSPSQLQSSSSVLPVGTAPGEAADDDEVEGRVEKQVAAAAAQIGRQRTKAKQAADPKAVGNFGSYAASITRQVLRDNRDQIASMIASGATIADVVETLDPSPKSTAPALLAADEARRKREATMPDRNDEVNANGISSARETLRQRATETGTG